MDIEKIKNYNQKVLALVLTSLLAFAVIGLISLVVFLFSEVFNFSRNSTSYTPEGIQVDESAQNTSANDAYKLHVTYNFPVLADTINQLYIIPVGHKSQYDLENMLTKKGRFSNSSSSSTDSYSYYTQESYINILIYDAKNSKTEKLFKQQIYIGQYDTYYEKEDVLIVFEAAEKDSNKDGLLTMADQTSLFFYSLATKTMKRAKMEGETVLQYSYNPKFKNAIIRFGQNPGDRVEKESEINPGTLTKYDYTSDILSKINDNQLNTELETLATNKK